MLVLKQTTISPNNKNKKDIITTGDRETFKFFYFKSFSNYFSNDLFLKFLRIIINLLLFLLLWTHRFERCLFDVISEETKSIKSFSILYWRREEMKKYSTWVLMHLIWGLIMLFFIHFILLFLLGEFLFCPPKNEAKSLEIFSCKIW